VRELSEEGSCSGVAEKLSLSRKARALGFDEAAALPHFLQVHGG
jgi:hypothetical protein